jgi:hypothetical protein
MRKGGGKKSEKTCQGGTAVIIQTLWLPFVAPGVTNAANEGEGRLEKYQKIASRRALNILAHEVKVKHALNRIRLEVVHDSLALFSEEYTRRLGGRRLEG